MLGGAHSRIDPTTLQLIGNIFTCRYASTSATCGTSGFQEQGQYFFIGLTCSIPSIVFYSFSLYLLSVYRLVLWGWGLRTDNLIGCISLSLSLALPTLFHNNNNHSWNPPPGYYFWNPVLDNTSEDWIPRQKNPWFDYRIHSIHWDELY